MIGMKRPLCSIMKKGDLAGLVMLLAAIGVLGLFFVLAPEAPEVDFGPVDVGGGSLEVLQSPSMTTVVFSAELAKPGFVSIHESVGPAPGPVIGVSSLTTAGEHADQTIALREPMTPGLTYIALLHVDDGDAVYESSEDMPVKTDGAVVRVDFKATEGSAE